MRQDLHDGVERLLPLGREVRPDIRDDRVLPDARIEQRLLVVDHAGGVALRVDGHGILGAVLAQHALDAAGVVHLGDQLQQDRALAPDRNRLLVDEVIRRPIALALPLVDGAARALVALRAHLRLILAGGDHHVALGRGGAFVEGRGGRRRLLAFRLFQLVAALVDALVRQHGMVFGVRGKPVGLVALDRGRVGDVWRLALQRAELDLCRSVVVQHPLRILERARVALPVEHVVDDGLLADPRDDRHRAARRVLLVDHLAADDLEPLQLFRHDRTELQLLAARLRLVLPRAQQPGIDLTAQDDGAVEVAYQFVLGLLNLVVLALADGLLSDPGRAVA